MTRPRIVSFHTHVLANILLRGLNKRARALVWGRLSIVWDLDRSAEPERRL